jgi:hypothetical protein
MTTIAITESASQALRESSDAAVRALDVATGG